MSTETTVIAETIPDYGLAEGVEPKNVYRREQSLIDHGTNPLEARRLAMEAEGNQVARDGQSKKEREQAEESARVSVGDRLRRMTLEKLLAYAADNKITVPEGTTRKDDVIAFLLTKVA